MAESSAFPFLAVSIEWIERHCVVPDGFEAGRRFDLYDWQFLFLANHYRIKPEAEVGQLAPAFHFRRSQVVLPQKAGKAPISSAQICLEAVGPAVFAGWAETGDVYRCSDWGCGCGWRYAYREGEAMGRPWPTPLIQITATSEEQTDNIFDALRPMIDNGPLHELIPKTGAEFIRLPGSGRIDTVTSNARSRLGQRVTFVVQDETGIWLPQNGMVKVAETQRRGLAGMGGRSCETTNAWDPTEDSVAQRTAESKTGDVYRLHPLPPANLSYANKRERRKIHQHVYAGCDHVDLESIEAEAAELQERDPIQAERFFGNRIVSGSGQAFNADAWAENTAASHAVADRSLIVVGVDGARFHDALAIVATEVESGYQWPVAIIERPEEAPDDYEHDFEAADRAMRNLFDTFDVWRVYIDPQYIEVLLERWQGRWGDKVIIEWLTHRDRPMAHALRKYRDGINTGAVLNDGDRQMAIHIGNAVKFASKTKDDEGRPMWLIKKPEPRRKIDAAMAGALSWECRGDALAAGATARPRHRAYGL